MVKTSPSNAWGAGSISGQGARIPHFSRPKDQNIKQKQYSNKSNKDFKNVPHQKKKSKKKKRNDMLIGYQVEARKEVLEKPGARITNGFQG